MSSLLQHPAFWFALLVLLLLLANLGLFLQREWEASHRAVDYARLNYPLDTPTLRRWHIDRNGRLRPDIVWSHRPAQWQLLIDGQPGLILPGAEPWIDLARPDFDGASGARLEDFRHHYVLRPLPQGSGPDLEFEVTRIGSKFYQERGMHFPSDIELIKTRLPAGRFTRHPVSYWTDDYRYLGDARLAEADRILREDMLIGATDAPLVRMEKIIRHLRTCWVAAGGVPKDDFRWADPLRIFQEMRDGTGKGWCTQNAQVYTFFANRAGVPTRYVFGATVQDNRHVYNGHSWAESYLAEAGRWTYVDPQASIIAVYGRDGAPLNSADLLHLCLHDALDGVTARIFKDWGWKDLSYEAAPGAAVNVPFSLVARVAKKEFNLQTIIKYRRPPNVEDIRDLYGMLLRNPTFAWTNFRRYLFEPAPAYSLLPTEGARLYRLRQSLFLGLVLSLGLLAVSFF
jgi:hypothetical protein